MLLDSDSLLLRLYLEFYLFDTLNLYSLQTSLLTLDLDIFGETTLRSPLEPDVLRLFLLFYEEVLPSTTKDF